MCILSRAAGLANTSSLLSPTRPSPTNRCTSPAALLVPRRPDEVRRLVRLTFVRPPLIMPSCFLWDYIKVSCLQIEFFFFVTSKFLLELILSIELRDHRTSDVIIKS
jgi:hypothetical protein